MKQIVILLMVCVFMGGIAIGQEEILSDPRKGNFTVGASFQMWRIQPYQETIDETAVPMSFMLPIGNRFNLSVSHTPAVVKWRENQSISGLSDTWVQGIYTFWDDKLFLNLGVAIPTGKTQLDSVQLDLTQELSRNIYKYRLPVFGQGLSVKGGFAFAYPIQEGLVLGLGAQYIYKGSYHPLQYEYGFSEPWDEEFDPGNEISFNVGLDIELAENMKLMLDGMYSYYGKDLWAGSEIFGSGQRITLSSGYYYRFNRDTQYLWAHLVYRQFGKMEREQDLVLVREEKNSNGFQLELNVDCRIFPYYKGGISVLADARINGKDEMHQYSANCYGGGLGAQYEVTYGTRILFHIKYLFGYIKRDASRRIEGLDTAIYFSFDL